MFGKKEFIIQSNNIGINYTIDKVKCFEFISLN